MAIKTDISTPDMTIEGAVLKIPSIKMKKHAPIYKREIIPPEVLEDGYTIEEERDDDGNVIQPEKIVPAKMSPKRSENKLVKEAFLALVYPIECTGASGNRIKGLPDSLGRGMAEYNEGENPFETCYNQLKENPSLSNTEDI